MRGHIMGMMFRSEDEALDPSRAGYNVRED
jgi:hypothetical protein